MDNYNKISSNECLKIITCDSIEDCKNNLNILLDCIISLINSHHCNKQQSLLTNIDMVGDAKAMFEMFYIKCQTIKYMLIGYSVEKISENSYQALIDYQSLFSLVRNLYEAFCTFEIVFIYPKTDVNRLFVYDLYRLKGLQDRQRFKTYDNHLSQKLQEDEEINNIKLKLQQSDLCKIQNNEQVLKETLKTNKLVYFNDIYKMKEFIMSKDYDLFGIDKCYLEDIYKYLCMNTHSSYISVLQYKTTYNEDDSNIMLDFVTFACEITCSIASFLIYDYCKLFPDCKNVFNDLKSSNRYLVECYNGLYRYN